MTKTIFEKRYMIQAQAFKAAEKEFGAAWAESYEVTIDPAFMPARYQVVAIKEQLHPALAAAELQMPAEVLEEKTNLTLAEALEESGETIEELTAKADKQANASMGLDPAKPRFSTCEKPTKKVWHIADSMPKASRKDVMAECVAQGIAYGTARTQYQAWFKASQECMVENIRKPYQKGE
jgi:hypothetical protein